MGEEAMDEPEPFDEWPRENMEFVGEDKFTEEVVDEDVCVEASGGCTVEYSIESDLTNSE
jgi:hypothetical protein